MRRLATRLFKICKISTVPTWRSAAIRYHVAAGVEHTAMLRLVGRLNSVIDVGANRGQFALTARKFSPQARIVSFEPLKGPAQVFRRVFSSDPRVILHEVAIAPEEREMCIHVSRTDDSSSLLPISMLQNTLFPGTAEKEVQKVQAMPLDAILRTQDIESPSLLKIDVQGYELEVLKGGRYFLPLLSYVYIECSFVELYEGQALAHEVINFLKSFDFNLSGIYNLAYGRQGQAVQGDFLFSREI